MSEVEALARERDPAAPPRIVVVQHTQRAHLGVLAPPLARRAELLVLRAYDETADTSSHVTRLVERGDYDALILLGGAMGVYERATYPFLEGSLALADDAVRRGRAVLGLCLGSQLLAQALGSPAYSGAECGLPRELGFVPLILEPGAEDDPVASLFSPPEPVLEWHRDTYDLPPGTTRLARSELYPMQLFRLDPRVYGVQFHPEVDADMLELWVQESQETLSAEGFDPRGLPAQARRLDAVIRRRGTALAGLFADLAAQARAERLS